MVICFQQICSSNSVTNASSSGIKQDNLGVAVFHSVNHQPRVPLQMHHHQSSLFNHSANSHTQFLRLSTAEQTYGQCGLKPQCPLVISNSQLYCNYNIMSTSKRSHVYSIPSNSDIRPHRGSHLVFAHLNYKHTISSGLVSPWFFCFLQIYFLMCVTNEGQAFPYKSAVVNYQLSIVNL